MAAPVPLLQRNLDLRRAKGDGCCVNIKTLFKIFSASLLCVAFVGRAAPKDDVGPVVSLGNNTFSITCEARTAFMRDIDRLKADATDAANKYCESQGKQIKFVSMKTKEPNFSLGYCNAKIVFMALAPGDPALLAGPAPADGTAAPALAPAPRTLSTDELVAELTKLDDLRKKGILTDDEFQAEKKKVLSHSN
jgi:hypothetical protein